MSRSWSHEADAFLWCTTDSIHCACAFDSWCIRCILKICEGGGAPAIRHLVQPMDPVPEPEPNHIFEFFGVDASITQTAPCEPDAEPATIPDASREERLSLLRARLPYTLYRLEPAGTLFATRSQPYQRQRLVWTAIFCYIVGSAEMVDRSGRMQLKATCVSIKNAIDVLVWVCPH